MGTLLDLVATLTTAPKTSAASLVEVTGSPPANDEQAAPEPLQAKVAAPVPAAERPAEARRNAWTITRGGKSVCTICGAPMTRDEALADARWRWPDADILEN